MLRARAAAGDRVGRAEARRRRRVEPDVVDETTIVEALDALPATRLGRRERARAVRGRPRPGWPRLAEILRGLRSRASLPLAELVVEVERALRLDIEVAARPGVGPAGARAHLDALADVAAGFATSADVPTLGAFLAWLEAAELRERGLAPGQSDSGEIEVLPTDARPSDVDVNRGAVQLLTVHAAKGLEWDIVAVPGTGRRDPADRSRHTARTTARSWRSPRDKDGGWRTIAKGGLLPYELRGDVESLPPLAARLVCDGQGPQRGDPGVRVPLRQLRRGRGAPAGVRRVHPGQARAAADLPRAGGRRSRRRA